jgi:argininosuccinate lyase
VLHALSQVMIDLSKLSTDLIIFSAPEFGYIELPAELCSGSSIMPQKKNPDLLELVRAKSATVVSALMQTLMITRALPSGYHRDFQETKQPLMESFNTTINAVRICNLAVKGLTVHKQQCIASFSPELFATDYALRLVQQGMPFREAYKQVATAPEEVPAEDPITNIQQKTHLGASGNLNLALSSAQCSSYREWIMREQAVYQNAIAQLLKDY